MDLDVFFNDGQNNQPIGFFSEKKEKVFLTVDKADSKENFSHPGVWLIDQFTDLSMPYWSPSKMGFYIPSISKSMPGDVVKVEKFRYKELLGEQAEGAEITIDKESGQPISVINSSRLSDNLQHDQTLADKNTLGHVRVGDGFVTTQDGVTNLKPASATEIGGVKIGEGLMLDSEGKISISGDSELPGYTSSDKEKILAINQAGNGINWVSPLQVSGVRFVQSVGHYWDEDKGVWKTIIPAGTLGVRCDKNFPPGTLQCNGDEVSRNNYPELFAAIGFTYGRPKDETFFNLPNLQARTIVGADWEGQGLKLGGVGGKSSVLLTANNMPPHSHRLDLSTDYEEPNVKSTCMGAGIHNHTTGVPSLLESDFYKVATTTVSHSSGNGHNIFQNHGKARNFYVAQTTNDGGHIHSIKTTIDSHKHRINSFTGYNAYTTADGQEAISLMQPYMALFFYIYTGKVLL